MKISICEIPSLFCFWELEAKIWFTTTWVVYLETYQVARDYIEYFHAFGWYFHHEQGLGKLGDVNKLPLLFETFSACSFFLNSFSCEEVVGNDRNKTSWTSPLFCTKKHQNPFSSLGERVVWTCIASSKKRSQNKNAYNDWFWLHSVMYAYKHTSLTHSWFWVRFLD